MWVLRTKDPDWETRIREVEIVDRDGKMSLVCLAVAFMQGSACDRNGH